MPHSSMSDLGSAVFRLNMVIAADKILFFSNQNVLIFFLFLHENLCSGDSFELLCQSASNEYPQHMFSWRNKIKNIYLIPPLIWRYIMYARCMLTVVLLNPDMPCFCKQYRYRSVGF